jgi:hypothetical protein
MSERMKELAEQLDPLRELQEAQDGNPAPHLHHIPDNDNDILVN